MNTKTNISKACEKANHVCDKAQYKEASLLEKIKLSLHLIYCKACRKYSSNNSKLTKTCEDAKITCLQNKEKDILKESLNQAIKQK